jgi:hypothetical protein
VPETFSLFSYCFLHAEFQVCGDALSDPLCVLSVSVMMLSDTIRLAILHIATVTSDIVLY